MRFPKKNSKSDVFGSSCLVFKFYALLPFMLWHFFFEFELEILAFFR